MATPTPTPVAAASTPPGFPSVEQVEQLAAALSTSYSADVERAASQLFAQLHTQAGGYAYAQQLVSTGSDALRFFVLGFFEQLAAQPSGWSSLSAADAAATRQFLFGALVEKGFALPAATRNRLSRVVVLIGRNEWPQPNAEFVATVCSLTTQPGTCSIGVRLLHEISEEFVLSTRNELPALRRQDLRDALAEQAGVIMQHLGQVLHSLYQTAAAASAYVEQSSGASASASDKKSPAFSNEDRETALLALHAVHSYFSWLPLSQMNLGDFTTMLFHYTQLVDVRLACAALEALCECVSKNYVPAELQAFLVSTLAHVSTLLAAVNATPNGGAPRASQDLVVVLTNFTALFVSTHAQRLVPLPQFNEFLQHFFVYALTQPSLDEFLRCGDVWNAFLDYVLMRVEAVPNQQLSPVHSECLLALSARLITLLQVAENRVVLDALDDESGGGGAESDRERYIVACMTMIEKVSRLHSEAVLMQLYPVFAGAAERFLAFATTFERTPPADAEATVRDLAMAARLFSLMAAQFREQFIERFGAAAHLLSRAGDVCVFVLSAPEFPRVAEHVQQTLAECLGLYTAFHPWLFMLEKYELGRDKQQRAEAERSARAQQQQQQQRQQQAALPQIPAPQGPQLEQSEETRCRTFVSRQVSILGETIKRHASLASVAASSLRSLSTSISSDLLLSLPESAMLIASAADLVSVMPELAARADICVATCNVLLRPHTVLAADKLDSMLRSLLDRTVNAPIDALVNRLGGSAEDAHGAVRVGTAIVVAADPLSAESKKLLYSALRDSPRLCVELIRHGGTSSAFLEVLFDHFLALFRSMSSQLGVEFAGGVIGTIAELLHNDAGRARLSSGASVGSALFALLLHVVEGARTYRSLLPSVLGLCMELYPLVRMPSSPAADATPAVLAAHDELSRRSADLMPAFFAVLHATLRYHNADTIGQNGVQALLHAYVEGIGCGELGTSAAVMNSLVALNERSAAGGGQAPGGVYRLMAADVRVALLAALLGLALSQSQQLHDELVATVVFQLAQADEADFYSRALPTVLKSRLPTTQLSNEQAQQAMQLLGHEKTFAEFSRRLLILASQIRASSSASMAK